MPPDYNIAPSTIQPVIRQGGQGRPRTGWDALERLVGFGSAGPHPRPATLNPLL